MAEFIVFQDIRHFYGPNETPEPIPELFAELGVPRDVLEAGQGSNRAAAEVAEIQFDGRVARAVGSL